MPVQVQEEELIVVCGRIVTNIVLANRMSRRHNAPANVKEAQSSEWVYWRYGL